jgi:hypothetical protein
MATWSPHIGQILITLPLLPVWDRNQGVRLFSGYRRFGSTPFSQVH